MIQTKRRKGTNVQSKASCLCRSIDMIQTRRRKGTNAEFKAVCLSIFTFCLGYRWASSIHNMPEVPHIQHASVYKASEEPKPPLLLEQLSTCSVNEKLSDFLTTKIDIGWGEMGIPTWLKTMCPEVVEHFNRFPSYSEHVKYDGAYLPTQTTLSASQSVCTMKIVKLVAASINARVYLHAGSHLAASVHGQPMPWDDDVDMWLDFKKKDEFLNACKQYGNTVLEHPRVQLHCVSAHNALKVYLQYDGMKKLTGTKFPYYSPFVDLFLFKMESGKLQEVDPKGEKKEQAFNIAEYFPTRPFYFAGVYMMGPQTVVSENRYVLQNCVMSHWNHRLEQFTISENMNKCIDCLKLSKVFPFVYDSETIKVYNSTFEQKLYPAVATVVHPHTITTIEERAMWSKELPLRGQYLTDQLPNLNRVEIDNTVSPQHECQGRKLKVVEFNAERGKRWLEFAELLKEADVIILNEMDIGMARTDQQHTTRLLAYHLKMNYAWGLEFLELTLGHQEDRDNIDSSEQNFHGLHGNAILSKCKISSATIFRDDVGPYFDNASNAVNALGTEKRLGGRMIMLSRIVLGGVSVVIGSTHKLAGSTKEVRKYIGSSPAIIAGDQGASFCKAVGLNTITPQDTFTWPSSCTQLGYVRGDNICSNMVVAEKEYDFKPCLERFGVKILLSDHSLVWSVLELPPKTTNYLVG